MSLRKRKSLHAYENHLLNDNKWPSFAMYPRRSRDEERQQMASIPQQIEKMKAYSEREQVLLALRPDDYPVDEQTINEIREDNKANHKKAEELIEFYKTYWVISERKSARVPFKREEWRKIIKLIKGRRIKGLLAYSPDRMCRNLLEGGELINLVESKYVKLKFETFHFEETAAGYMMLGFLLVFAEHFSRKLSEDSTRGTRKKHKEGRACGVRKYGYTIDENDYFVPDEFHFPILRKACERKMFDRWSDAKIADEMNQAGWHQCMKKTAGRGTEMNKKKISENGLWTDPFLYGAFERHYKSGGLSRVDLRKLDGYNFIPILTEPEWHLLQEVLTESTIREIRRRHSIKGQELDPIKPIPDGMLTLKGGYTFTFNLPNRKRDFEPKLEQGALIQDIVKPSQIRYRYMLQGKSKGLEFKWSEIDAFLTQEFQNIEISEEDYQAYLYQKIEDIKSKRNQCSQLLNSLNLRIGRINKERDEFYDDTNAGIGLTGKQKAFWERKDSSFESKINELESQKAEISRDTRDIISEQRNFFDLIQNLPVVWEKSTYVQKRSVLEILTSNIISDAQKGLTLVLKPELAPLFVRSGRKYRINFEQFYKTFLLIPKKILVPIFDFRKNQLPRILEQPS